jgi:hypothetical protein
LVKDHQELETPKSTGIYYDKFYINEKTLKNKENLMKLVERDT